MFGFKKNKNEQKIVCKCKKVHEDKIIEAINNGAKTVKEVWEATDTGNGFCKGRRCNKVIEQLLVDNK